MASIEAICFDVWGAYGSFRVPSTTRGYLTYPFMPRTAAIGLIASMLGVERNKAYDSSHFLYHAKIAIQCLNTPNTIGFRTNLIRTKKPLKINFRKNKLTLYLASDLNRGLRSPQTDVYLKNPRFRFYVYFNNPKKMKELETRIKNREFHYYPYFGRANLFCYPEYIGKVFLEEKQTAEKSIISLFPTNKEMEIIGGTYNIIFSVPMNYEKSRNKILLSKVSNIIYFVVQDIKDEEILNDIKITGEIEDCYTITDISRTISFLKGKQIVFLPSS